MSAQVAAASHQVLLELDPQRGPFWAWWHPAVAAADTGTVVVIVPPWGREELCAHAALRDLAVSLASTGTGVLRLELAGSGDSGCVDDANAQAGQWVDQICRALDVLTTRCGARRVVLLGLRLGAALAALAASRRQDISGLVAVAPVTSGRQYLRELRALQAAKATLAPAGDAAFEAGGFALATESVAAVQAISLTAQAEFPAPQVLLLDRDDMPAPPDWAEAMRSRGAQVAIHALQGYADLMLDPHNARAPRAAWDAVVAWVRQLGADTVPAANLSMLAREALWSERLQIPVKVPVAGLSLAAMWTRSVGSPSGDAIILLNAGAMHRGGPGHAYTQVAHRWAAAGHAVLQLDLAGLGDSAPRPGRAAGEVYAPGAEEEVLAALALARQLPGVMRCHLVGLCAGAYVAFKTAQRTPDVASIVAINPLTFFWREGMSLDVPASRLGAARAAGQARHDMLSAAQWRRVLTGQIDLPKMLRLLLTAAGLWVIDQAREVGRMARLPMRDDLARELRTLARQGTLMNFVFAETDPGEALLRSQGGRLVARLQARDSLRIERIDGADHTFTSRAARRRLIDVLQTMFANRSQP